MEPRYSLRSRDERSHVAASSNKGTFDKDVHMGREAPQQQQQSRRPSGARTYPYHTRGDESPVSLDSGYLQDVEIAMDAQKGAYCSPRVHAWVASHSTESETVVDAGPERVLRTVPGAVRPPPIASRINWFPTLLLVLMLLSGVYYFYVRVTDIMSAGWQPYQVYFLALEGLGVSAFLPYAVLLTRGVYPTGSPGLEEAGTEGERVDPKTGLLTNESRIHVRVLVPTYKEPVGVIQNTIMAALSAPLPASVRRTIYLCDDGNNPAKGDFVRSLNTEAVQYVSGRARKTGEINGKSANLNHCLKRIFANTAKKQSGEIDWTEISNKELLVVFDADMCAKRDFFLKVVEVLLDDDVALCLTPQAFHNIDPMTDLFNNINLQFWEYWLPGAFAWGYIACTGTNFCLRIRSLAHCGWFPEYTITEDYALGMELKTRGYKASYLMDYLAVGEAPEEVRNVFRQRSRWTKGHYQVFFSSKNPLINWELPFFQRLWYSYAAFAPFCTIFTIPGFMIAPFVSVLFGIHPLVITYHFVLASTIYFTMQFLIQNYVRDFKHMRLMWFAQSSNYILWFTYVKACFNTILAVMGFKNVMFKSTDKGVVATAPTAPLLPPQQPLSQEPPPPPPPSGVIGMVQRLASVTSRVASPFHRPRDGAHQTLLKANSVRSTPARSVRGHHGEYSPAPATRYSRIDEMEPVASHADDSTYGPDSYAPSRTMPMSSVAGGRSQAPPPPATAAAPMSTISKTTAVHSVAPSVAQSSTTRVTRAYPAATTQPHTPTYSVGQPAFFLQDGSSSRPISEVALKSKRMAYPMQAPKVPEDSTRVMAAPVVMNVPPASPTPSSDDGGLFESPGPSASQVGTGVKRALAQNDSLPLPPNMSGYASQGLKQPHAGAGPVDTMFTSTLEAGVPSAITEETSTVVDGESGVGVRPPVVTGLHARLETAAPSRPSVHATAGGTAGSIGGPRVSITPFSTVDRATAEHLFRQASASASYASAFLPVPSPYMAVEPNDPPPPVLTRVPTADTHPLSKSNEDGSISVGGGWQSSTATGTSNWGSPAPTQAPPGSPVVPRGPDMWVHTNPAYGVPGMRGPFPPGVAATGPMNAYPENHDLRAHPAPDAHHVQLPPNVVGNLAWTGAMPGNLPAIRVMPRTSANGAAAEPQMPPAGGARPAQPHYPPLPPPPNMPPGANGAHVHYGPTYVVSGPPPSWNANGGGGAGGIPTGMDPYRMPYGGPYNAEMDHPLQANPLLQDDPRFENHKKGLLAGMEQSHDAKAAAMQAYMRGLPPLPPGVHPPEFLPPKRDSDELKAKPGKDRLMAIARSFKPAHISDFGQMFDPLALFLMWAFNMTVVGLGFWQLSLLFKQPTVARFKLHSPVTGNPYLIIAILWSLHNSVPAYIFLHYCISSGSSFKFVAKYLPLSSVLGIIAMVLLWLMIPADVPLQGVMDLATSSFLPTQTFNDTNENYYFVSTLNETQVDLQSLLARGPSDPIPFIITDGPVNNSVLPNLLGGIIGGYDHVKSVAPSALTITWLAWALIQFPQGFSTSQTLSVKHTIKTGADLFIRSNLNLNDPTNPIFVAMLGDPRDYTVVENSGYDPAAQGKSWTSPETDPQLVGSSYRTAWLLTRETVGSDLLADAAAALAAASVVLRSDDPAWATTALQHAQYLYAFAQSNDTAPVSACNYIPCTSNVTARTSVTVQEVEPYDGKPACWYADWDAQMCKVAMNKTECDIIRLKIDDVYKTKASCCEVMASTKSYTGNTAVQGLCALPDDQFTCYAPDLVQRTCYTQEVNLTSGEGCAVNPNTPVFGTLLSCCNYLQAGGIIDTVEKPPTGLCARQGTDAGFLTCYIPNIINATCDLASGEECTQFGVITSFDHAVGCCNYLVGLSGGAGNSTLTGICQPYRDGVPVADGKVTGRRRMTQQGILTSVSDAAGTFWSKYVTPNFEFEHDIRPGSNRRSWADEEELQLKQTRKGTKLKRRRLDDSSSSGIGASSSAVDDSTALTSSNATANLYPMPDVKKVFTENPCTVLDAPDCQSMIVDLNVTATYYNSTSVLDDLAWGGVWLYRATSDPKYLGAAQRYIARHLVEEVSADALLTERGVYTADWDSLLWPVYTQLEDLTDLDLYSSAMTNLLSVWVFGDAIQNTPAIKDPTDAQLLQGPTLQSFEVGNTTYNIIPTCQPNNTYENNCYDGLDNDCNGLIDLEDPRCGLFPILYTPSRLAFSQPPSLGNVANMAFLAMVHAEVTENKLSDTGRARLRCWTLSQIGHIIGSGAGERSYVVGYGSNPPTRVQHRGSSCPVRKNLDDPICDWDSGFLPGTPNPQLGLVLGALVDGPDIHDVLNEIRSSDMMRISLQSNVGFLSSLAGLQATGTQVRTCESLLGVWQRYVGSQGTLS